MVQELVSYQTDYLFNRVLKIFDKAILRIPAELLDFRPTPENMSAKELSYHVYQVIFLLIRAVETILLVVEEAIHHRRQLMIYLRLMGIKPPHLYDYR